MEAPRVNEPFDADWRFLRGDDPEAWKAECDHSGWCTVEVPHDWSREDLPPLGAVEPVVDVVTGVWRFKTGDDAAWKDPGADDSGWQEVKLPATWEDHSGYTADNVYGWFRRRFEVPAALRGKDIILDVGKIDDVDETFVNGTKVGGKGRFPPAFRTAYATPRQYRVEAGILKGDGTDVVAVRCFDGQGAGGIYAAGGPHVRIGPFDSVLSAGGGSTGHVVGGTGWYRKRFEVGAGRRARIVFDGVYMNADVWCNGVALGAHPYGYTAFSFDLTPHLKLGGAPNTLAVRVRNEGANSRWYSGSGIFRRVRLEITGDVRVAPDGVFVTTPVVTDKSATVRVAVAVENHLKGGVPVTVRAAVKGPGGKRGEAKGSVPGGGRKEFVTTAAVASPKRWSPGTPHLYRAVVEVVVAGKTVDEVEVPFGIRTIELDSDRGLLLNGKVVKLKGGCVHHDNGALGSATIGRAEERRVELLKAAGYNAIRTSHNPPSAAFLDACDRLGMLVMDESFDCWQDGKNPEDYGKYFNEWWKADIDSMVLRDRNHPCVFMWSIGNEIPERYEERGAKSARMLADRIRELDPTRPVTSAFNGVNDRADPYLAALEVAGYNYNPDKYVPDRARHPKRLMVMTESFGVQSFDYWAPVETCPWVLGDFIWTAIDYLGESGIGAAWLKGDHSGFLQPWPWFVSNCSDFDYCGFVKPQGLYRRVMWGADTIAMAVHSPIPEGREETVSAWGWPDVRASWNWPGCEGKELEVHVYANCDTVRLKLNGKAVGEMPGGRAARYLAKFKVPYAAGVLKAEALVRGRKVAESVLRTAGAPARLRLTADRSPIRNTRDELVYVTVEVLDEKGTIVPDASDPVRFSVAGAGELVAVGDGHPSRMASFMAPERRPFAGRCLAILRPTQTGTITLGASLDGVPPAEVRVTVK